MTVLDLRPCVVLELGRFRTVGLGDDIRLLDEERGLLWA
jgi:hypothetical protein